jgi:hypothetical protein
VEGTVASAATGHHPPKRRAPQFTIRMAIVKERKAAAQQQAPTSNNGEAPQRTYKVNPEIDAKLNRFMESEPGLVDFVKKLPREDLERKFILKKMEEREQRQAYSAKVKAWLDKPEQADLRASIASTISLKLGPERQEQAAIIQAKNFIKNTGIRLS